MDENRGVWRGRGVNNWHYGDLIRARSENNPVPTIIENGVRYSVFPETIGECIRLTDINKKFIFEGDVIADVNNEFNKYVVKFSKKRGGFFPIAKGDGCGCCEINVLPIEFAEIIGNIHDNPELLEGAINEDT